MKDKIKNAINELRHTMQFYTGKESFEIAILALEKQDRKDVVAQKSSGEYFTGRCPACNSKISDVHQMPFCNCCGQALKWSI